MMRGGDRLKFVRGGESRALRLLLLANLRRVSSVSEDVLQTPREMYVFFRWRKKSWDCGGVGFQNATWNAKTRA